MDSQLKIAMSGGEMENIIFVEGLEATWPIGVENEIKNVLYVPHATL